MLHLVWERLVEHKVASRITESVGRIASDGDGEEDRVSVEGLETVKWRR